MVANDLAIGTNIISKVVSENIPEKKALENIPEKTSNKTSQDGEATRDNININREVLEKGIEKINENIKIFNTKLSFSIDEPTGRTIIRISNKETNEVIREIPPLEFLKIAAKLSEVFGLIIDEIV